MENKINKTDTYIFKVQTNDDMSYPVYEDIHIKGDELLSVCMAYIRTMKRNDAGYIVFKDGAFLSKKKFNDFIKNDK